MSTIFLTENGWSVGNDLLGVWTPEDDIVITEGLPIQVNGGTIDTGEGDDSITGEGSVYGIFNKGSSIINTGEGDDSITGIGGILNNASSTIDTGKGDDSITGIGGNYGIFNIGTLNTGNGDDSITGEGSVYGIFNIGTLNTGNGDDTVNALNSGFGDDRGTIDLGNDDDLIIGSGTQFVDGGTGFDTAELGGAFSDFQIALSNDSDIVIGGMSYTNVEHFVFNDAQYDLGTLQGMVPTFP